MVKPTRQIVKPNVGMWNPKGKVWFKKNDDSTLGRKRILSRAEQEVVKREVEETRQRDNAIKKEVEDYLY